METALIVALVAAAASVAAAGVSGFSAHRSLISARQAQTVNHQISQHDSRVERFRQDYVDLLNVLAPIGVDQYQTARRVSSACEILSVNPVGSPELLMLLGDLATTVRDIAAGQDNEEVLSHRVSGDLANIREAVRATLLVADERRLAILEGRGNDHPAGSPNP